MALSASLRIRSTIPYNRVRAGVTRYCTGWGWHLTSGMMGFPSSPLTYRKGISVLSLSLNLSSGKSS